MKKEELRRAYIEYKYLGRWIGFGQGCWVWNEDGSVDVDGDLYIIDNKLSKLPFKFNTVIGFFNCRSSIIETLDNFPIEVGKWLVTSGKMLSRYTFEDIRKVCKVHGEIY